MRQRHSLHERGRYLFNDTSIRMFPFGVMLGIEPPALQPLSYIPDSPHPLHAHVSFLLIGGQSFMLLKLPSNAM